MLGYVYPNALTTLAECLVSIKRIQSFLTMDEKAGSIENSSRLSHIYKNGSVEKHFKSLNVKELGIDNACMQNFHDDSLFKLYFLLSKIIFVAFESGFDKFLSPNGLFERRPSFNSISLPEYSIELKNIIASWRNNSTPTLRDVSFRIRSGSLCVIVGCVGSGKV